VDKASHAPQESATETAVILAEASAAAAEPQSACETCWCACHPAGPVL